MESILDTFREWDLQHTGLIMHHDLEKVLTCLGIPVEHVHALLSPEFSQGNDTIQYEAFLRSLFRRPYDPREQVGRAGGSIILDSDCGFDDLMALVCLVRSGTKPAALITTVHGMAPTPEEGARCMRALLSRLRPSGEACPEIASGASEPLLPEKHAPHAVGAMDWGPEYRDKLNEWIATHLDVLSAEAGPSAGGATDAMLRQLGASADGSVDFVAIGPLTNLARLVEAAPPELLASKIRSIWVMGGVLDPSLGNSGPGNRAELNFYADPEAARRVLTSPLAGKLRLMGLDVCNDADPRSAEWGRFICQVCEGGLLSSMQAVNYETFLFDSVVVYAALHEGHGFEFAEEHVTVGEFGELTVAAAGTAGASPVPLRIAKAFPDREVYIRWLLRICEEDRALL